MNVDPLVPILPNVRTPHERTIDYLPLREALTRPFPSRAATCAYSLPSVPHRLVRENLATYGGVPMILLLLDVDDPHAHRDDVPSKQEWRDDERPKIHALLADRPGGFLYFSRRGWRGVWRIDKPFVIHTAADEERWRASYLGIVSELRDRYSIVADPSGSRWTQPYDLPHARRDA